MSTIARYIIGLATVGTLALIVRIDAQSNVTPRVVDGSIVPAVESVHPYIAPDGSQYEKGRVDRRRQSNLRELRHFCRLHLVFLGEQPDAC